MAQGVLPFKYETEKKTTGMTALAGLPVYLDLARVIGLSKSIEKHLKVRTGGQGWTDSQIVLSLILTCLCYGRQVNLAGGDCVDDIKKQSKSQTEIFTAQVPMLCKVLRLP